MTTAIPASKTTKTHPLAIVSLILSFAGFTLLPWIGCVFAIVTGTLAKKEIRANPDQYAGEGFASAGVTLGWIGSIGIFVLAVLAVIFLAPVRTVGSVMLP